MNFTSDSKRNAAIWVQMRDNHLILALESAVFESWSGKNWDMFDCEEFGKNWDMFDCEEFPENAQNTWNPDLFDLDPESCITDYAADILHCQCETRCSSWQHKCTPNKEDWNKLVRMMKFLKSTKDHVLTLAMDDITAIKGHLGEFDSSLNNCDSKIIPLKHWSFQPKKSDTALTVNVWLFWICTEPKGRVKTCL